jgi:hypothetical protein
LKKGDAVISMLWRLNPRRRMNRTPRLEQAAANRKNDGWGGIQFGMWG